MTIKLLALRLVNFKGAKDIALDLKGGNARLYGDNGTFKTTCYDAFVWLLFGADSLGRKDFDIKTLTPEGEPLHGLEHTVEAVLGVNGKPVTLRKTYREVWSKQRGAAERTFTGHTVDHFIDDVPVAKRDYDAYIGSIIDEQRFRLLTSCTYFNEQLHWQDRRKLLVEACGNVSDADVIAADPALAPLEEILGRRTLDDHRRVLQATRTKTNKSLEQIPIRISEVERGLPDIEGLDAAIAGQRLLAARTARTATMEQLVQAEQGGGAAQMQARVAEIGARRLEIETSYRRKAEDAAAARRRKAQDAELAVSAAERELQRLRDAATDQENRAGQLEGDLLKLRQAFRQLSDEEFAYTEETACPTCGQALPEEMVEAARAKALEQWNVDHAERLEEINRRGRELRARQDQANAAADESRRKITAAEGRLVDARRAARAITVETERPESDRALDADSEYRRLGEERDALTAEIRRLQSGGEAQTSGLRSEIAELDQAIASAERIISQVEQHARGTGRIEELAAEERQLAAEYERLEHELHLIELFTRTKVRLLTDQINSHFTLTKWRLFNELVNGGIEETCVATHNGVPYGSGLNHGARINVGLDCIRTLGQHFGVSAPVWVDNRESVTRLLDVPCQVISLIVSEPDKTLRIVKEAS